MLFPMIKSCQFISLKPPHSFPTNLLAATGFRVTKDRGKTLSDLWNRDGRRPFSATERLLNEKPRGYDRKHLMVIPAAPTSDFVVTEPRFAFSAPERIFNPMLSFDHTRQFFRRCFRRRIREKVVVSPLTPHPLSLRAINTQRP